MSSPEEILRYKEEIRTLGELQTSSYSVVSIKEEMRRNLIRRLQEKETLFPTILGFQDTVVPQIENAILAGHDMILLGERGQAKTRLIRGFIGWLDEYIPIIKGCEINDNPFVPICRRCQLKVIELGNRVEIVWVHRSMRYSEKLATPDVTIADLIGEIDPIKLAEGRHLSDEMAIHFGLIPRINRGIFAINELPDLPEKVQVGLFNIMEERDVQIKGFPVRLPLDVFIVATANPEDYTSRGRIITPLKDRYRAQIRTHYPRDPQIEIQIVEQERRSFDTSLELSVPPFMKEIIVELTFLARRTSEINQRSGVSVRMSISNYESLISNAEKRALHLGESEVVPRVSDLQALIATTAGKIELEYSGEEKGEGEIIQN
jgi:magnesium chelatase subunit I